jgi:hypothetical protein
MTRKRRKWTDEEMEGLRELRSLLEDAFEAVRKPSIPPYPYDKRTNTISLPVEVEKEVRRIALKEGGPQAVKKVAYLTGARLGLSKRYVDSLLGRNTTHQSHRKRKKSKRK